MKIIAYHKWVSGATRNMAKEERDNWNEKDYNLACREYARLNPEGGYQP